MHGDLQEAIDFHVAVLAEGGKALVGYHTAKAVANVVLLSEIPTTYDKRTERQVNAGNLLLRGVPGVGKTFFGVILSAISDAKFARLHGGAGVTRGVKVEELYREIRALRIYEGASEVQRQIIARDLLKEVRP